MVSPCRESGLFRAPDKAARASRDAGGLVIHGGIVAVVVKETHIALGGLGCRGRALLGLCLFLSVGDLVNLVDLLIRIGIGDFLERALVVIKTSVTGGLRRLGRGLLGDLNRALRRLLGTFSVRAA